MKTKNKKKAVSSKRSWLWPLIIAVLVLSAASLFALVTNQSVPDIEDVGFTTENQGLPANNLDTLYATISFVQSIYKEDRPNESEELMLKQMKRLQDNKMAFITDAPRFAYLPYVDEELSREDGFQLPRRPLNQIQAPILGAILVHEMTHAKDVRQGVGYKSPEELVNLEIRASELETIFFLRLKKMGLANIQPRNSFEEKYAERLNKITSLYIKDKNAWHAFVKAEAEQEYREEVDLRR